MTTPQDQLRAQVLESVLQTALEGEALYTIVTGAPAVCEFDWRPARELLDQFSAEGNGSPARRWKHVGAVLQETLLDHRLFCFPSSLGRIVEKAPLFVIRLAWLARGAWLERTIAMGFHEDDTIEPPFSLVCVSVEALQRSGVSSQHLDDLRRSPTLAEASPWWASRRNIIKYLGPPLDPVSSPFAHISDIFTNSDDELPPSPVSTELSFPQPGRDLARLSFLQHPGSREEASPLCVLHPVAHPMGLQVREPFLSTPTYENLAPTGWRRTDLTRPLSADEVRCIQDRWAVLRVYRTLRERYQGRLLSLLEDWSCAPHQRLDHSMAHAVAKARAAGLPLPSGEALSRLLAADAHAPQLQRLLRGWRYSPPAYVADFLREAAGAWNTEQFKWSQKLGGMTLAELSQVDNASLPPGIARMKMLTMANKGGGLSSPFLLLHGGIAQPYLVQYFDQPEAQDVFVKTFSRPPESSGDGDDQDEGEKAWYDDCLSWVNEINQELVREARTISLEDRPRALVSRLWELLHGISCFQPAAYLAQLSPMPVAGWPTTHSPTW